MGVCAVTETQPGSTGFIKLPNLEPGPKVPGKTSQLKAVAAGTGALGRWSTGALGHWGTGRRGHSGAVLLALLASEGGQGSGVPALCAVCPNEQAAPGGETSSALPMRKCRGKLARLAARGADQLTLNPVVPACACAALERRTACSSWQSSGNAVSRVLK